MSSLEVIKGRLSEPGNYSPARRVGGLLVTTCVDRRLVGEGGAVRTPGNTIGVAAVAQMDGRWAETLRMGVHRARQWRIRPGAHVNVCALDHNLVPVMESIANKEPRVIDLAQRLGDLAGWQVSADTVADNAARAHSRLQNHKPDTMAGFIADLPDSEIVTPPIPAHDAEAYVIDLNTEKDVLNDGVVPTGEHYLDTSMQLLGHSDLPPSLVPNSLAFSAATAVLVADTHNLPILVASGMPGAANRQFVEL